MLAAMFFEEQTRHLCWFMSLKCSAVRCLSNPLSRRLVIFEKELCTEWHFWKKITITVTEVVLIQLTSFTVVSKQKIKLEARNTISPSYHAKVSSTQNKGILFFYLLAHNGSCTLFKRSFLAAPHGFIKLFHLQ